MLYKLASLSSNKKDEVLHKAAEKTIDNNKNDTQ